MVNTSTSANPFMGTAVSSTLRGMALVSPMPLSAMILVLNP